MDMHQMLLGSVLLPLALCSPFDSVFKHYKAHYKPLQGDDPGSPLFLTPYIDKGDIADARKMSEVSEIAGVSSYSGFFTVNDTYNSNMFFWFFPALNGDKEAPLLLWLQGGPGDSSLFGLFNENGPLVVDSSGQPSQRKITWNSAYHMLYIDNPVGTGFSFTKNIAGFSTNEEEVAVNLYSALTQFFTVFSDYQPNDFYITGESYAGKFIPAIGYKIHKENMNSPAVKINLKGVAIGDGWCDPENMVGGYAPLLYQIGLADTNQRDSIQLMTDDVVKDIQDKQFLTAKKKWESLLIDYLYNITGSTNVWNFLKSEVPPNYNYYIPFLNTTEIRRAIHVGNLSYSEDSDQVETAMGNDFMNTVKDKLSALMDNYKVLIYNGQLDIVVAPTLSERMLQVLDWSGRDEYLKTDRIVWKIGDDVAGYVRVVGKFVQAIVRGGGHILPFDQPERAIKLIENFVAMI